MGQYNSVLLHHWAVSTCPRLRQLHFELAPVDVIASLRQVVMLQLLAAAPRRHDNAAAGVFFTTEVFDQFV